MASKASGPGAAACPVRRPQRAAVLRERRAKQRLSECPDNSTASSSLREDVQRGCVPFESCRLMPLGHLVLLLREG